MDSVAVKPAPFYVAGARPGDMVCPECQTLYRGSRFSETCNNHTARGVRLVPYEPPTQERPPDRDEWDRD